MKIEKAKHYTQFTKEESDIIVAALMSMQRPRFSKHALVECFKERINPKRITTLPSNGEVVEFRYVVDEHKISTRVLIRARGNGKVPCAVFSLNDGTVVTVFSTDSDYTPGLGKFTYEDFSVIDILRQYGRQW